MDISNDLSVLIHKVMTRCAQIHSTQSAIILAVLQTIQPEFQAAIAKLHRDLNSLVPIARLPDEVLGLIFEFASMPIALPRKHNTTQDSDDRVISPPQIAVSRTCSRWRRVALAFRCWNIIDLNLIQCPPSVLSKFLARLATPPDQLRISVDHPAISRAHTQKLQILTPYWIHVTNLQLSFQGDGRNLEFPTGFPTSIPTLKSLSLFSHHHRARDEVPLFQIHCPHLVHLECAGVLVHAWNFPQLVSLRLSEIRVPQARLHAMITASSCLQSLELESVDVDGPDNITSFQPRLSRLSLTYLSLDLTAQLLDVVCVKDIAHVTIEGSWFMVNFIRDVWGGQGAPQELHVGEDSFTAQLSFPNFSRRLQCRYRHGTDIIRSCYISSTQFVTRDITSLTWELSNWDKLVIHVRELPRLRQLELYFTSQFMRHGARAAQRARAFDPSARGRPPEMTCRCDALRRLAFTFQTPSYQYPSQLEEPPGIQVGPPQLAQHLVSLMDMHLVLGGQLESLVIQNIRLVDGPAVHALRARARHSVLCVGDR